MMDDPQSTVQLAQQAAQPERREPGPGDVGPTTPMDNPNLVTLPMTEEEVGQWWQRVRDSDERLKPSWERADILLDEYLPIVSKSGAPETVKSNRHFRNVHTKIGQLFYRTPDVVLDPNDPGPATNTMPSPLPPMPGMPPPPPIKLEDVIAVKQAVLKKKLGRDGIKAGRLMDELLFDVAAWAGVGCCKVGYKCYQKPVQKPILVPGPQPPPQPGSLLGLAGPAPMVPLTDPVTGQPQMQTVPVTVYKEWYGRRFSPKKLVCNTDLYSTRFEEDATFVGMHFYMSPARAMRDLKLTEDEAAKVAQDDKRHLYANETAPQTQKLVHGVELWVKLSYFTDEVHPLAMGQLILVEGINDRPIVWRPSPDQTFDGMGQLTDDSLEGFPIKVLTVRDMADHCIPLADSAFSNSGIKQIGTWRRQSVKLRDVNIGKFIADGSAFDDAEVAQLKSAEAGEVIIVQDGRLQQGIDKVIGVTPRLTTTADDFRAQDMMSREIDETIGISPNSSGAQNENVLSATEIASIDQGIAGRSDKELNRVIDFYLDLVRALDQLLMRYATQDEYVKIGGEEGANRIFVWNGKIGQGKYLYDIAPDSQLRVDTAREFQLLLNFYNLAAPDPLFNRAYALRRLARMRGLDPMKTVLDPMQQLVQPAHGGQQKGEAVNQHVAGQSGGRPNAPGSVNHRDEQNGAPPPNRPQLVAPNAPGKVAAAGGPPKV